jgi:hypothetical protein
MSALQVVPVGEIVRERRAQRLARFGWVAGAAILMLAVAVQPFRDTDVWWHLALGRLITAHGIPAQEPFSFLSAANPWVGQQWLFEVMLAGLVGAGGAGLASIVMGVVAVLALIMAALSVPRGERVPGIWLAFAIVLSGAVMAEVIGVRGQVLSVFGVAVVLFVIARWREGSNNHMWLLPPLFLVWANMHAGFVAGLIIIVLALLLARPLDSARALSRVHLGVALGVSVLVTFLNPAGPGLYAYVLETFSNPTLTQVVTEWASPDFHNVWLRLFAAEAILLVVLWVVGGGPDRFDAIVAIGLLVATLSAQRNVSLFAIVALPQIARYGSRAWTLRVAPRLRGRRAGGLRIPAVLAAVCIAVLAAATAVVVVPHVTPAEAAGFEASRYPEAAATYTARTFPGQRLYTIDSWGGYLAYRFPQGRVVFLYDETAVFGSTSLQQYLDIHLLRDNWRDVLSSEAITHAIVVANSQEASAFHELGWGVDCYDATSGSLVMSASPATQAVSVAARSLAIPPSGAPAC